MIIINAQFAYKQTAFAFDMQINKGEMVAIVGASGSGKSTLLNLIAGFEWIDRGSIRLDGLEHSSSVVAKRPISMLFQENNVFAHLTVWENIALGISPSLKLNEKQQQAVENAAKSVKILPLLRRRVSELSGGQKQRVALAREMLRDKPILLLDEPFSALDKDLRASIFTLINELRERKNLTVLLVTHQLEEIRQSCDRVIEIIDGKNYDIT